MPLYCERPGGDSKLQEKNPTAREAAHSNNTVKIPNLFFISNPSAL
jgi:hypothetical protein